MYPGSNGCSGSGDPVPSVTDEVGSQDTPDIADEQPVGDREQFGRFGGRRVDVPANRSVYKPIGKRDDERKRI